MKITRYYSKKTSKYYLCIMFDDNTIAFNNDLIAFVIDKYATMLNVHPISVREEILNGNNEIHIKFN